MSEYSTNRPGIPLATNGYVSAVNDRFIQQTILSDGTAAPANLSLEDMARVAFSIQHTAVRMTIQSIGGIRPRVRSSSASLALSQKSVRLGITAQQLCLSLSKN
jgi:hypothetical protein